jgi:hypothetical protein
MRRSLGTAVLFGMLGVTGFGLLFTPAFYTFIRIFGCNRKERELSQAAPANLPGAGSAEA